MDFTERLVHWYDWCQSVGWLPYVAALAAIGLLPVKTRTGGRLVTLALAVLWSLQSGILPVVESAILLVWGAYLVRLELTVRKGPWTVAGTVLIVYALLPPLLSGLRLGAFHFPYWPLSPWILTCGVLFFSAARTMDLVMAFALPLAWVLFGSLEVPCAVGFWGLRATLLVGALFLATPWELRTAVDRPVPAGTAYRLFYRRREPLSYGLWLLILLTGLAFFLLISAHIPLEEPGPGRLPLNLALLSALGIGVWLTFPAWQHFWFRSLAWTLARVTGRLWGLATAAWRWGIFLLAAAAVAFWRMQGRSLKSIPPFFFLLLLLFWLAFQAFQARRRLVIGRFADYTGSGEKPQEWVTGLGARLQNELARISDLLKVIDEAQPPQKSDFIEAGAEVLDVGEILKSAGDLSVGPLKVPMRFVENIVNQLVNGPRLTGALHKIDGGYVLTASVSGGGREGSWRVDSSKIEANERRLPAPEVAHKLVEQLAYRVAANLVEIGSPRWRAVRCYTDGLRAYRETQQRKGFVASHFREAECAFIKALGEDQGFAQCHYNLGVVYKQLGELHSSESAFRRALAEKPQSFDACYGLAETFCQRKDYAPTVWFCDAAIAIRPSDARAWDLNAYAVRMYEEKKEGERLGRKLISLPAQHSTWNRIVKMREIAVALSWRALCGQALRGPSASLDALREVAYLCARNLGVVLTRAKASPEPRAQLFFRQAELVASKPELALNAGRAHYRSGQWIDSLENLHGVFADGLKIEQKALLWSLDARLRASKESKLADREGMPLADPERARIADQLFLDVIAGATAEDLETVYLYSLEALTWENPLSVPGSIQESLDDLLANLGSWGNDRDGYRKWQVRLCHFLIKLAEGSEPEHSDFARVRAVLSQHRQGATTRQPRIQTLEKALESEEASDDHDSSDLEWVRSQIRVKLARLYLEEEIGSPARVTLAEKADGQLAAVIESLEKRDSRQPREQGLYALVAKSHLVQATDSKISPADRTRLLRTALIEARLAVEMEPESAPERLVLIEVYSQLGDVDGTRQDAMIALQLDPGPETLRTIGACFWTHVASLQNRALRHKVLREAVIFFRDALREVEAGSLDPTRCLLQIEAHGWAHFWLGRFLLEIGRYDDATGHLRTSCELGFKPLESRVELAWAYLLARQIPQAEKAFAEARAEVARLRERGAAVAAGVGEERDLAGLSFDACFGRALLAADRDAKEASRRLKEAGACLPGCADELKDCKRIALAEIYGRILLFEKKTSQAVEILEKAARWGARPGAWCALAQVALERAQSLSSGAPAELRRAREAFRQARETDIRGRHRRELRELRRALRQAEKELEAKVSAGSPKPQPAKPQPSTPPAAAAPGST